MIRDIFPHEFRNAYRPDAVPEKKSIILSFDGSKVLADTEKDMRLPFHEDLSQETNSRYLFSLDDTDYFITEEKAEEDGNFRYCDIRELREKAVFQKYELFAVMTGKHLSDWYRDSKFCGRCGARSEHSETERAMKCPECGNTVYPRIMPAVIVGVKNGDSILLTRYRSGYQHNALVAGFTEIGETLEETVSREVMEEAGIRVKNIRYYKSQPWGMANDILAGFFCEADGDTQIHMDSQELRYAEWVKREDIILQPDDLSLTNAMMAAFKSGEEK